MPISWLDLLMQFEILTFAVFCFHTRMDDCQMIHRAFSPEGNLPREIKILFVFFGYVIYLLPDLLKLFRLCSMPPWQISFLKTTVDTVK